MYLNLNQNELLRLKYGSVKWMFYMFDSSDSEPEEFRDDGQFAGDPDYIPESDTESEEEPEEILERIENESEAESVDSLNV